MTPPPSTSPGGVLVIGECLADVAPSPPPGGEVGAGSPLRHLVAMPGGSPANVAVGLARLGARALFAGRLSTSGLGPWLRAHLAGNGVDLGLCPDADEAATIALVTLDAQGRATYAFYGPETADWQWRSDELPPPADLGVMGIGTVHTGSLAAVLGPGAAVLEDWLAEVRRAGQAVVSFDPNVRPGLTGDFGAQRRRLARMVASAHLVKASHEDLEAIFPGDRAEEAGRRWLEAGADVVVVTEGRLGARLVDRNGTEVQASPPPVTVVDTIGAGDSFTAGLLAYLGRRGLLSVGGLRSAAPEELQAALLYAVRASAYTCTRAGADPPSEAELEAFTSP
jgi:fructokinase